MSSDPLHASLRPEVVDSAAAAFRQGDWDEAVFKALRDLEAYVQKRIGSAEIGGSLVQAAFDTAAAVSAVSLGADRRTTEALNHLFKGALGIKGDRSHKAVPAIGCRDAVMCLRLLAMVSLLYDLLDQDINASPSILNVGAGEEGTLLLQVARVSPSTVVEVDGAEATVVSRTIGTITVRIPPGASDPLTLRLVDGPHRSPELRLDSVPTKTEDANFHEVVEAGLSLYRSQSAVDKLPETGVALRSRESGTSFIRIFPSSVGYKPGQYVSWDWDTQHPAVGPAWVKRKGELTQVWSGSMRFSGRVLGQRSTSPKLRSIQVRPVLPKLRAGDRCPLRLVGFFEDGPVRWREDLTDQAVFSSTDQNVAIVAKGPSLMARTPGVANARATYKGLFSEAPVSVATFPTATVVEYLGGLLAVTALVSSRMGLLITNRQSFVWVLDKHLSLRQLFAVPPDEMDTTGVDCVTVDATDNIYVRHLFNGQVLAVYAKGTYTRSEVLFTAPEGIAVMSLLWTAARGLIISTSDGRLWSAVTGGRFEVWGSFPKAAVGMAATDTHLWGVAGGGGSGYMRIAWDSAVPEWEQTQVFELASPSAITSRGEEILIADFHAGYVLEITGAKERQIARGFTNPTSLTVAEDGSIFVGNFGSDTIDRILP